MLAAAAGASPDLVRRVREVVASRRAIREELAVPRRASVSPEAAAREHRRSRTSAPSRGRDTARRGRFSHRARTDGIHEGAPRSKGCGANAERAAHPVKGEQ
jgi:hypothetical protein